MRRNILQALYTVLMGLFVYSCSELVLPKQVGIKGTLSVPIRVGAANLGSMLKEKIEKAFLADEDEDEDGQESAKKSTKVYNVDYKDQPFQTFLIKIPIEMTEDLNPDDFLKTIDRQINDGISEEPKDINAQIPYYGFPIPINEVKNKMMGNDGIPPVSLADIARYVITIDFDQCNGSDVSAGIGLNFHFDIIPKGLKMKIECEDLHFSTVFNDLHEGDNIFGNEVPLTNENNSSLKLNEYKNDAKKLIFTMTLQSKNYDPNSPDPDEWDPAAYVGNNFVPGNEIEIKGEMRFFRVWTEAKINLVGAIKASPDADMDDFTGKYPDKAIDLSEMTKYLSGGFNFNGIEGKIYMDSPSSDPKSSESINDLKARLILNAQYGDGTTTTTKPLYDNDLIVNSDPLNLDNYLDDNDSYTSHDLPEYTSENDVTINKDTIADIFRAMPAELFFIYTIELDEDNVLVVTPGMFPDDPDNSAEGSKITTTMMIMLPMSLTAEGVEGAEGEDNKPSAILLPDMFGKGDLFGRKKPEDLFGDADVSVDYIRMTVDLSDGIFSDGRLFINKDEDLLFPEGIRLSGKKTVLTFTDDQLKIIEQNLIFPDIKIEIDNDGTINIPKDMAIVSIKLEMKSLINVGEL